MSIYPELPNINPKLLNLQRNKKIVFFCGAGISAAYGLPNFDQLVGEIIKKFEGNDPDADIKQAKEAKSYELTLTLLEKKVLGFRQKVRKFIKSEFSKEVFSHNDTKNSIHHALLKLSQTDNGIQIVTTNFDDFFEKEVLEQEEFDTESIERYYAPYLPLEENWSGIVYLHGLLSKFITPREPAKYEIILSSMDVGKAYLSENWATKFLVKLFREHDICFVGYSLTDPAVQYIIEALREDSLTNEKKMFALCWPNLENPTQKSIEDWKKDEIKKWKGFRIEPVIFDSFHQFEKTSIEWAKFSRKDSFNSILEMMKMSPDAISKEAKKSVMRELSNQNSTFFQELNECQTKVSFDRGWIHELFIDNFSTDDLVYFGFKEQEEKKRKAKSRFSLQNRPEEVNLSQYSYLCSTSYGTTDWNPRQYQLAMFLINNIDDPFVLGNLIKHGPIIHPRFKYELKEKIYNDQTDHQPYLLLYEGLLEEKLVSSEPSSLYLNNDEVGDLTQTWLEFIENLREGEGLSFGLTNQLRTLIEPIYEIKDDDVSSLLSIEKDDDLPKIKLKLITKSGESIWNIVEAFSGQKIKKINCEVLYQVFDEILIQYEESQTMIEEANKKYSLSENDIPVFSFEAIVNRDKYNHDIAFLLILANILDYLLPLGDSQAIIKRDKIMHTKHTNLLRIALKVSANSISS